ncbi:MAG TPA: glycosyltransferase family 52 protein [Firmicutes bacterium]|nr:glycosyltransferase family 52 protein [Bacillota bacterium]
MTRILADRTGRGPVLYHAVSSYQLLEVLLHRLLLHPRDRAVLLLPDFIVGKYPQYRRLARCRFFDEVRLFPYLRIPHGDEAQVAADAERACRELLPLPLAAFSDVYVAGAHFYFSLCLIRQGVPFYFFEDAAGMLSRAEDLYRGLHKTYPLHADIARRHGLFDGSAPGVRGIYCLKRAQSIDVSGPLYRDFAVEEALEALPPRRRRALTRLFLRRRIRTGARAVLLTQHLANLGIVSPAQQRALYEGLRDGPLRGIPLVVKPHPDDTLDYAALFPDADVLRTPFPSELLPYVFHKKPPELYTFSSTGAENLRRHFIIHQFGRNPYAVPPRFDPGQLGLSAPDRRPPAPDAP